MGDISWHKGQNLWVPHEDVGYTIGTVMDIEGENMTVRLDEFEENIVISTKMADLESTIIDKKTLLQTEDLTHLPDLHRPSLLDALRHRFVSNKIYTYTGHILIAINPFKDLDLYSKKAMKDYSALSVKTDLSPHVFYIANSAFQSMVENGGRNQSVLVSGESGAGKTVTTKIVLDYLTFTTDRNSSEKSLICEKVLQSNPVLEAFGNAKTLRNDNSSRFGKLIQLEFFGDSFRPILGGCKIDTYLLEKARVMHHSKGERNFHIFYELYAGATDEERSEFELIHPEDSRITNAHRRRVLRSDTTDAKQWSKTITAMRTVGISEEEIKTLKRIVSAVMHLGEIEFEELEGSLDDSCEVSRSSTEDLEMASKLLEISVDALFTAMCCRIITLGSGKTVKKNQNREQADESRNAIVMALYERTFLWLVWRTNKGMRMDESKSSFRSKKVGKFTCANVVSVLDIFGFEVFKMNTFEQLFINYANEVLQQLFNEFVFKLEQEIYQSEGIDWTKIEFPDNSLCISLVEHKKVGLLKMLDDECLLPRGSDNGLHQKIKSTVAKNFSVLKVDENRQTMERLFTVLHFAGPVEYTTASFCLKNKNELRKEQIDCVRSSACDFIRTLLPANSAQASGAASADYFDLVEETLAREKRRGTKEVVETKATQRLQQSTVGANFKAELSVAIEKIKASELHFIRCIKPNDENMKDMVDRKRILEQLNYSGVLEAVRISRLGYTSRFLFKDFVERFFILLPGRAKKIKSSQNAAFKNQVLDIVETSSLTVFDDYQVGSTKLFLKSEAFNILETVKRQKQSKSVLIIQKFARCALFRLQISKMVEKRRLEKEREKARKKKILEDRMKLEKEIAVKNMSSSTSIKLTTIKPVQSMNESMASSKRPHGKSKNRAKRKRSDDSRRRLNKKPIQRVHSVAQSEEIVRFISEAVTKIEEQGSDAIYDDQVLLFLTSSFVLIFSISYLFGVSLTKLVNLGLVFAFLWLASSQYLKQKEKVVKRRESKQRRRRSDLVSIEFIKLDEGPVGRTRSVGSRSRRSGRSKRSKSKSKSKLKNKNKKPKRTPSVAKVLQQKQSRREVQSLRDNTFQNSRRFTGIKIKEKS